MIKIKMKSILTIILTVQVFLILGITAELFGEVGRRTIENFISTVKKYDSEKRETVEAIEKTFNVEYVARRTLNLYWEKASEEQRAEYLDLFKKLAEKLAYAKARDYFLKTRYSVLGEEMEVKKDFGITLKREEIEILTVRAEVDVKVGTGIKQEDVFFYLKDSPSGWILFDVDLLAGSIVREYRNQFSRVIRSKGGIEGLLESLRNKVLELSS